MQTATENTLSMIRYITAAKRASAEQTIEKSRFIAYIQPVESREEAEAFFREIRNLHKDATHNVPAFVLGEKQETVWSSDDGEPGGTSGTPILTMLLGEGVSNVAVMVTRYFGGIKLGTGGLARAYSGVARLALAEAGKKEVRDYSILKVRISYQDLAKIQKKTAELGCEITEQIFEAEVTLSIKYESEQEELLKKNLLDISCGNLKILS